MVSLLRLQVFRRYYLGYTASSFGDSLTPFALAFAVLDLTGSPSALALVVLASRVPVVVFVLVGGAVGDRFSRRTVMLTTDLVRCLVQAATAAILLTGAAELWMLVILQLVAGAGTAFFNPAGQGLLPTVIDTPRLQRANALLATSRSATSVAAVATAGLLVATAGPGCAVAVDAATFLASAAALRGLPRAAAIPLRQGGLLHNIRGGLHELGGSTWLWVWAAHGLLISLCVISPLFVLGPYIADRYLTGSTTWAVIGISYTIGGVAGGLLSSRWQPRRPMTAAITVFALLIPLPALLAWPANLTLLVPASVLGGVQISLYNVLQATTVQHQLPQHLVGRATSLLILGSVIAVPLGTGLAGLLAEIAGARLVLAGAAAAGILITAAALTIPTVHAVVSTAKATTDQPQPHRNNPALTSQETFVAPHEGRPLTCPARGSSTDVPRTRVGY
ncbi:MFS transporter [uncultured Friedmanniella sp.]|uniref:MFS transporter n=1 Tax=uncultured Friedmanniella sp. TaxID=335381 RepID=UPI0035CBA3E3